MIMARPIDPHPLGKCSVGRRLDIGLPGDLGQKLDAIAMLHGKLPTVWVRDLVEKAIEGEWVFIKRRSLPRDEADDK